MWAPALSDLKTFRKTSSTDDAHNDDALQLALDAAIAYVEGVHAGRYYFPGESGSSESSNVNADDLPEPDMSIWLGTLLLASRWFARRATPEFIAESADLGSVRIPSFDSDIERLLRIGRFAESVYY